MFANLLHAFTRKPVYGFIILGLVLLTIGLGARARIRNPPRANDEVRSKPKPGGQRIEGEVIALSWTGFEPQEISRSAGPFLLLVNNYSHLPVATLLVERKGKPVRRIVLPAEKRSWSDIVDLPPGNYTLRETNHSHWTCQITVR